MDPHGGPVPGDPGVLAGGVLLLETSEDLTPAPEVGYVLRSLGERGLLDGGRRRARRRAPRHPTSSAGPGPPDRAAHRRAQRDMVVEVVGRYNPGAVVCVGVPFGHTRPQWIVPYGGQVTLDGRGRRVWADYD